MKNKHIEYKLLNRTDLNPVAWNPRQISEKDSAALRKSIKQFGLVEPLVVRKADMSIVGGHQRFNAACDLMMDDLPCAIIDISETEAKLLNVAMNKIHGEWDVAKLGSLIDDLKLAEADISLTGFDEVSLAEMGLDIEAVDAPFLPDGDRSPFQQMTFTLYDDQAEVVKAAIVKAKADGHGESEANKNSNGNAIAWIAEVFNRG